MAKLFCCVLIVVVGSLNSSIVAKHAVTTATLHSAISKQKKRGQSKRPTPAAIWKGIKAAALDEVRSKSHLIIAPKFSVEQVGSTWQLTIGKGDINELGFKGDPYEIPFKKQMLIEALRQSLAATDLTKQEKPDTKIAPRRISGVSQAAYVGRPYLVSAEKLVKKIVADIESEADKARLDEKLRESEKQIDDILYDKIYEAVEQTAQRNGYEIIYGRGSALLTMFSVTITTVPDGGKVFVMTDLVYRKQLITKTDRSRWPWIEIVQNPYRLAGRYRYQTIWGNGKRTEGSIYVTSNSPLRILPN